MSISEGRHYSYEDEDEVAVEGEGDDGLSCETSFDELSEELGVFRCVSEEGKSPIMLWQELAKAQEMLQSGKGSDMAWTTALQRESFAVVDNWLEILQRKESSIPMFPNDEAAARCLAFAGNVYRRVWVDYACDLPQLQRVMDSAQRAVERIRQLLVSAEEASAASRVCHNYLGFDERDIKAYNLVGYEEQPQGMSKRRSTHGIAGLEAVDDTQASILVWLLLLFHFFAEKNPLMTARLRLRSSESEDLVEALVAVCQFLLESCAKFTEDSYLSCIKVVAAINRQFPAADEERRKALPIYSRGEWTQGLMHILNDVGFPSHLGPETLPILHLCIDLMHHRNDIFGANDVNVLIDIILRELNNIAEPGDEVHENSGTEEEIRVMYIRLAGEIYQLRARGGESAEIPREADLLALMERLSDPSRATWSADEASKVKKILSP